MAKNLAEVYKESAQKYGDNAAFYSKDSKKNYIPNLYKDIYQNGIALAESLIEMGVNSKENIGLMADHRLEWVIADCGILSSGCADVPRGTDVTETELEYILNHSEAKVVFVEHDKMLEKLNKVKPKLPNIKTIVIMDPNSSATGSGIVKMAELIEKGKKLIESGSKKYETRVAETTDQDVFTLIYTSGTTGLPKGVMLTHRNMLYQLEEVLPVIGVDKNTRILSILPVWHIFERVFMYGSVYVGASTYFTNVRDMRDDFQKAKPMFMASAPRLWESIYQGIYTKLSDPKQTPPVRKKLFDLAYFFSKHFHASVRFLKGNEVDYEGRNPIASLFRGIFSFLVMIFSFPLYFLLDKVVLSNIRKAVGGQLKATVSGGGALQRHVDAFFNDIGLNVIEGYGMTETAPVIACRTWQFPIMGSVGKVAPKTEVQLRDFNGQLVTHVKADGSIEGKRGVKGIIFVRGPQVMKGYYKNPEATTKALKDGWMDTGDIGIINYKDCLTLTGRAKETVVLLGGENVEPVPIENKITESPYIFQAMVVGQDQKNLGAIIVPEFTKLKEWCASNGITETDEKVLVENPKVLDLYKKEIKDLNSAKNGFKSFEQVTPFFLIVKPFEVGDEMTNLFKLKRHIITEKYKDKIAALYKDK
ncbi:MAG: AMP-binding protein [Leptospiraceae bacterium]|nr:AMP-binding protein [Leptospiraceae bacterium]MCP5511984.1 AMP-binding protein [Leptospiraceae bacterium]